MLAYRRKECGAGKEFGVGGAAPAQIPVTIWKSGGGRHRWRLHLAASQPISVREPIRPSTSQPISLHTGSKGSVRDASAISGELKIATCHLPLATCRFHLPLATCRFHLPLATCRFHLLLATCHFHLLLATCRFHLLLATCHLLLWLLVACNSLGWRLAAFGGDAIPEPDGAFVGRGRSRRRWR